MDEETTEQTEKVDTSVVENEMNQLQLKDGPTSNIVSDMSSDAKEESNASMDATPNPPKSEEMSNTISEAMEAPPNLVTEDTATTNGRPSLHSNPNRRMKRKSSIYNRVLPKKKVLTSEELEQQRIEEERQKLQKLSRKNARVASRMREAHHVIQPVKPLQLTIPKSPVLATSTRATTHRAASSHQKENSSSVPKLRKRRSCTDVQQTSSRKKSQRRLANDENANPNSHSRPMSARSRPVTKPVPFHLSEGRKHCCVHSSENDAPAHHNPKSENRSKSKVFSGVPMVKTRKVTEPKTPFLRTAKNAERRKKLHEIKPSVNNHSNIPKHNKGTTQQQHTKPSQKTTVESNNAVSESISENINSENITPQNNDTTQKSLPETTDSQPIQSEIH